MRIPRVSGLAKVSTGVFVMAVAALPILSRDRDPSGARQAAEAAQGAAADVSRPVDGHGSVLSARPRSPIDPAEEASVYAEAAEAAFAYLRANRAERTGLVKATEHYDHITTWDMGSLLLGLYSAMELGLTPRDEAVRWIAQVLETMNEVPLFDGAAYNKSYAATTAQPIGMRDVPSPRGKGWSSTDLGRLLIAFKVLEQVPELADAARRAAGRIDVDQVVREGYLHGAEPRGTRTTSYQEGRIGYEQYAATGFALWGHRAEAALDPTRHGRPVTVEGHRILADERGAEWVTSEPFILMGMEVGWTPPFDELASSLLRIQEARYEETGQVTIVSEDALQHPPHYFYYYSVWSNGRPFVVGAHGAQDEGPRWVSAKAAYAWHSLLPGGYTWRAVDAVEPARSGAGWASGVYEGNGRSTGVRNLNTAAVILEAALYRERGRPLLEGVRAGS